jgi:hypothetical protein
MGTSGCGPPWMDVLAPANDLVDSELSAGPLTVYCSYFFLGGAQLATWKCVTVLIYFLFL